MREMKDSGVAWIGEIPKSWNLERLQWHISEIKETNKPEKTKQILSLTNKRGVIPYEEKGAQGNVSKEDLSQYKLAYPDTIVANSMNVLIGSVGKCNYYGCVSPVYYVYKPNDGENLEFINYIFQTEQFQKELRRYANGILEIRLRVSSEGILKRKVAFPSTDEQQKIVVYLNQKLSQVDSLIANVQAQIEKLKTYKQSLITEVVTKGLDPNAPMKDSGVEWIGKIPKHWQTSKLRTRTTMLTPMRDKPADLSGPIPWIRIEDYCGKYISSSKENLGVSTDTVKAMNLKIYPVGTILCTSSCDLGKCAIVEKELVSNQRFIGIIPTGELVSDFLYYLMLSNAERLNTLSTGSIQANLSRVSFEQLLVQFPPMAEQIEIAKYLDAKCNAADNLISLKESKIEKLQQYKRSLIYEYVTGKKEVV